MKYTGTPFSQLAGPRKMRTHKTDAQLGLTVTTRRARGPFPYGHAWQEVTGQVWSAADHRDWGSGMYWIATPAGFYVAHEESWEVIGERTADVPLFDDVA